MTHRVFLVGESNPYGSDPRWHCIRSPRMRRAGGRLARVLGMTDDEYLDAFERRNLMQGGGWSTTGPWLKGGWSAPLARKAADDLLRETEHSDRLVLLGARVSAAFGVNFRENLCRVRWVQVGTDVLRGRWALVVPHPSGRSREWNDPQMRARVKAAVEQIRGVDPEVASAAGETTSPTSPSVERPTLVSDLSEGDRSEVDRFTKWLSARARWTAGEMSPDEFARAERELYPNGLGGE